MELTIPQASQIIPRFAPSAINLSSSRSAHDGRLTVIHRMSLCRRRFNPDMKILQSVNHVWVEIVGALILSGLFLFWDFSRALFIVTALVAIGYYLRFRPALGREHIYYSAPIYSFVGIMFLAVSFQGFPDWGLNALVSKYFLMLLAVPVVGLYFLKSKCNHNPWLKFALAGLVLGITALFDTLLLDKPRADGGDNAALFGFVAVGITALIAASLSVLRRQRHGVLIYVGAITAGLVAILLSGTRGSWIAAAVIIFITVIFFFDRYSLPKRISISIILITSVALLSLEIPLIQQRVDRLVANIENFLSSKPQTEFTSAWYRIEGATFGWHIGLENKFLGVGPGNFRRSLRAFLSDKEGLQGFDAVMRHAHNQYIQTFVISGFIGLFALLILIGGHLWLFSRYLSKRYPIEVRSFALAGVLLVVAYFFLGFTGVPFERKKLILVYGFSSASCWGGLLANLRNYEYSEDHIDAPADLG
jgi:O-antigen ligase